MKTPLSPAGKRRLQRFVAGQTTITAIIVIARSGIAH
jgi:hypothetical protein